MLFQIQSGMVTDLKLTKISVEDLLNHPDKEYNITEWENKINRIKFYPKCQFYFIAPNEVYSYTRFFVSYVAEGIYFFSNFDAYSSILSNNGFCKVSIDENGQVWKYLFLDKNGKEGYAQNCSINRKMFKNNLAPRGIMVSNDI